MALPKLYEQITWVNDTTPALNEDNLNAMSQALDDIDDRLIDLAGTIMEDVPQIIADMEILEPAIESIDENVARAEAAADSAEQYAEEIAPPIEVVKDYTDIITVDDAINKSVIDLKVKVDPVQDLHGYTKPWVGGAGDNKLEVTANSGSSAGITFTVASDGVISCNNATSTGEIAFTINSNANLGPGDYILSGCPSGGSINTYNVRARVDGSWGESYVDSGSGVTIHATTGITQVNIQIRSGVNTNGLVFKPMITPASTPDSDYAHFRPYKNICPITGHSEAKVTRAGRNLWDEQWEQGNFNASGSTNSSTHAIRSKNYIPIKPGSYCLRYTDFYKSSSADYSLMIVTYDSNKTFLRNIIRGRVGASTTVYLFDVPSDVAFLKISVGDYSDTKVINSYNNDICLNVSDSNFNGEYAPYMGEIFTIDLDGTRYGGVLDVTSGVLTVLNAFDEYDGSNDEDWVSAGDNQFYISKTDAKNKAYIITNEYEGVSVTSWGNLQNGQISTHPSSANNILRFRDDSLADVTALRTKFTTTPLQVVYELATPETITLTAEEVTLLWAYNTLWADTGDISLKYDASGVLRIANAKLDTETLKTIAAASSDFSDFKARIAAL